MTKKEISELKKLYQKDTGCITRIAGCYVNGEKEPITTFKDAFYSLPEEETFKYYEIFRKTLSGSLGKNLLTLDYTLQQETEGDAHPLFMKLTESGLTDDALLEEFYTKVIETYEQEGNYLILLIHNTYDVPGKTSDGFTMEDASDSVYNYLLCSICPVALSKPGLSYEPEQNVFQNRNRDWVVGMPKTGFLFPSFTDRCPDIHSMLYYSKDAADIQDLFIEEVLGATAPTSAAAQREKFQDLIETALGKNPDCETILGIQDSFRERLEENEQVILEKQLVSEIFTENGVQVTDEALTQLDETPILASNAVDIKKIEIKTEAITVQAKPEFSHLVETKIVDGRKSLVIALEGPVTVNGIPLNGTVSLDEDME